MNTDKHRNGTTKKVKMQKLDIRLSSIEAKVKFNFLLITFDLFIFL